MTASAEMTGFVVLIVLFSVATMRYIIKDKVTKQESFMNDKQINLWWVIDDMDGNSGNWLDWGARLLRHPNSPFLNIHLRRCREMNEPELQVVPLLGREEVHRVLRRNGVEVPAEAEIAPGWLWKSWSSAQMVCYVGGLWVDSHVLFLKPITPILAVHKALRFGTDEDEELLGKNGSVGSAGNVLWGIEEGCGLWKQYAQDMDKLIRGGPLAWNAQKIRRAIRYLQDKHLSDQIPVNRVAEWSRFKSGKKIQVEDLLERFVEGGKHVELPPEEAVFVPMPNETIHRSIPHAWFLRMSENQLMEANFLWAKLAVKQ